jgi:hypothetical protein
MRKIEQEMSEFIRWGGFPDGIGQWRKSNTEVRRFLEENDNLIVVEVYLHGNLIAREERGRIDSPQWGRAVLKLSDCGWKTPTTKSRINAVLKALFLPISLYQSKGQWFLWNRESTVPFGRFDENREIKLNPWRSGVLA